MPDLDSLVNSYLSLKPRCGCDDELEEFSGLALDAAISLATLSVFNGRRHSHQRRLSKNTLDDAQCRLLSRFREIEECQDFESLHQLVVRVFSKTDGAGELYAYDVAHRIGHSKNSAPELVYLHTGTRIGARNLGFRGNKIELAEFPRAMHCLTPAQAEDFLCIYKDDFLNLEHRRS